MLLQLTAHKRFGSIDLKINQCLILEARELSEKSMLMEEILHQLIDSLSQDLRGFIHPKWCRISSINRVIT